MMDKIKLSKCVEFRLTAYDLYSQGSVKWTHPVLAPDSIICKKSSNPDNPGTYFFPDPKTGKLTCGINYNTILDQLPKNVYNWGDMHCAFEQLYEEGWKIELNKILITL